MDSFARSMFLKNHETISLLIRKGADMNATSYRHGETPFAQLGLDEDPDFDCEKDPSMRWVFGDTVSKSVYAMVRGFSRLASEKLSINKNDIDLIRAIPKVREYFTKCI